MVIRSPPCRWKAMQQHNLTTDVLDPKYISDKPPQINKEAIGDVRDSNLGSDDPSQCDNDDVVVVKYVYDNNNTKVVEIPFQSMFQFLNPSSSKPINDFDPASSLDEMDIGDDGGDDGDNGGDGEKDCEDDDNDDEINSAEQSSSDTGSSNENIAEPFTLLEMCDQIFRVDSKIENVNAQVEALDWKLDHFLKYISKVKTIIPSIQERASFR